MRVVLYSGGALGIALVGVFFAFAYGVRSYDAPVSAPNAIALSDFEVLIPSANLPPEVRVGKANNNMDAVLFNGREFLAFRTAPHHWPNEETALYVVSRPAGEEKWRYETRVALGRDLREPRFLVLGDSLFLYFAVLAGTPTTFAPEGMVVSELGPEGTWTAPVSVHVPGFIPWSIQTVDGTPYLSGYTWGSGYLGRTRDETVVYLLTTADGYRWEPAFPALPTLEYASHETAFTLRDGVLYTVSRNEFRDEMLWGSKICKKDPARPGESAVCVHDDRKFDSPLLFNEGGTTYLIARRNLTKSGNFELGLSWLPDRIRGLMNNAVYWVTPKRCSLWTVDRETLSVSYVLDLPSAGDTCFPALVKTAEHTYHLYNYSSPLEKRRTSWVAGQRGETFIYRVTLRFEPT